MGQGNEYGSSTRLYVFGGCLLPVGVEANGRGHSPNLEFPMSIDSMRSELQEIQDSRYDPYRLSRIRLPIIPR
jgi:hypothetical protein